MPLGQNNQSGDPLAGINFTNSGDEDLESGELETQELGDNQTVDPKVLELAQRNGQNETMRELLKDPDFQTMYRMKHSGQGFKIVPVDQQESSQQNGQQAPTFKMPAKLGDLTTDQFQMLVQQTAKQAVAGDLEQLKARTTELNQFVAQNQLAKATADIQATAAKYSDFPQYQPEITRLAGELPTLNAEQLYVLARMERGTFNPGGAKPTATERPISQQHRPQSRSQSNVGSKGSTQPASRSDLFDRAFKAASANYDGFER